MRKMLRNTVDRVLLANPVALVALAVVALTCVVALLAS